MTLHPHAIEPRTDTRLYNGKLGMWLFLAAEGMFFGALYSSYAFLRTASDVWPSGSGFLPLALPVLATATSAISCVTSARAWLVALTDPLKPAVPWVIASGFAAVVSATLLILQTHWTALSGGTVSSSNFYALYLLLLWLHIFAGLGAAGGSAWMTWKSKEMAARSAQLLANRLECLGLFMQFQGLLWLVTFLLYHVF